MPLATNNWKLETFLPLLLFVLGIRADHPHDAFSADDLAVFANPPDTASDFHDLLPVLTKPGIMTGESTSIANSSFRLKPDAVNNRNLFPSHV